MVKKIVDLSLEVCESKPTFPTLAPLTVVRRSTHEFSWPRYQVPHQGMADEVISLSAHTGTHLDAPFHYYPKGITIESISLENVIGEAMLLDVTKIRTNLEEEITSSMLKKAAKEQATDDFPKIVLIRIWPGKFGEEGYFTPHVLSSDAAEWIRDNGFKTVGVNTVSIDTIDYKLPEDYPLVRPAHWTLCSSGIIIVENLTNLEKIGKNKFTFIALPLKFNAKLSSCPVRAVAIVE